MALATQIEHGLLLAHPHPRLWATNLKSIDVVPNIKSGGRAVGDNFSGNCNSFEERRVCASVVPGSWWKETKGLFRDDRSLISALYVAFHDDSRSLSNFHKTEEVGNDDRNWLCIYIGGWL